jgi:glycosyltransferase involved in cell wall biosynthesis
VPIELVVSDFASDDWPLLEWIEDAAAETPVRVISVEGGFSRGLGLNVSVAHAKSDRVLLCDADLLFSPTVLRRAIEVIDSNQVWFPILRYLNEDGTLASWSDLGYGVAGVSRRVFSAAGGIPEFRSWGGEDEIFAARVGALLPTVRERFEGIQHQWHPEWCRHEYYGRPMQADYYDYVAAQSLRASIQSGLLFKAFHASHSEWVGTSELVLLFSNGRMERAGGDTGGYEYEEGKYIVLNWDRWPPETVMWDESGSTFRDSRKAFTLTPVVL